MNLYTRNSIAGDVMDEPKDNYTVMIFRGSLAGPLRFSFSKTLVRRAITLGVGLLIVQIVLLSQVVIRIGEMWELKALRAEVLTVREQTTAFSTAVNDLKRRLLAMKEVNQRLRLMLGIEPQKSDNALDGRGGESAPEGEVKTSELEPAVNSMTESSMVQNTTMPNNNDEVASKVQEGLAWLQTLAGAEERTLQDLTEVVESRQARWSATPSIWPVKGWVTSGFGQRVSPFTGHLAMHEGLDIGAPPNTPIQAPAAGRVTASGFDPRMGNMIALDHGFGIETAYGHMAKILVKNGQKVKRGDVIGLVGSTGLSTGPHLHYLVKSNSRPVDPQRYILE
ncbi:MAG: M23 family metallopeptidase [Nitrospiraceae bacterium]